MDKGAAIESSDRSVSHAVWENCPLKPRSFGMPLSSYDRSLLETPLVAEG